jgi:hypothetical protein
LMIAGRARAGGTEHKRALHSTLVFFNSPLSCCRVRTNRSRNLEHGVASRCRVRSNTSGITTRVFLSAAHYQSVVLCSAHSEYQFSTQHTEKTLLGL